MHDEVCAAGYVHGQEGQQSPGIVTGWASSGQIGQSHCISCMNAMLCHQSHHVHSTHFTIWCGSGSGEGGFTCGTALSWESYQDITFYAQWFRTWQLCNVRFASWCKYVSLSYSARRSSDERGSCTWTEASVDMGRASARPGLTGNKLSTLCFTQFLLCEHVVAFLFLSTRRELDLKTTTFWSEGPTPDGHETGRDEIGGVNGNRANHCHKHHR